MAATTASRVSPAILTLSSPTVKPHQPINSLLCPNFFFSPISASHPNPTFKLPRLRIARTAAVSPKRAFRVLAVSGFVSADSGTHPESEPSDSPQEATFDTKLPRRRLLVQFTCNACGESSERLVNPLAYERGLVYVQCAGCLQHHKLVDNLGLVIEYDLREGSVDSNTEQV